MSPSLPTYSIDTSALIDGLERYYRLQRFPTLWDQVSQLVTDRRLFASDEVWDEVSRYDKPAKDWCKPHQEHMFVATDDAVAQAVRDILKQFPRMVMTGKGRNRADPFVVAVAQLHGAIVVTGEGSDGHANRPKIPYVCEQLGVRCITFTDLIDEEDWSF